MDYIIAALVVMYNYAMWKYVRLLRLQDQYTSLGGALAAGVFLGTKTSWIIVWATACTCISTGSFILNELVDRTDVDRRSWNPIHIRQPIDIRIGWCLFVLCTLAGLILSVLIGMFPWAMLMAIWYGLYSLPPVRLKAVCCWDILTQIGAGWVIPFGVPILITQAHASDWMIVAATSLLGWQIILPYQLADFTADKLAGFHSTHVVVGIRNSLLLGITFAGAGMLLFVAGGGLARAPWISAMVLLAALSVYLTVFQWLPLTAVLKQESAFRSYWRFMKPSSQLLLLYVIMLWFVW